MKKQLIILFISIIPFSLWGQKFFRKTNSPCNEQMTDSIRGRWVKNENNIDAGHIGMNKEQVQQVINRLDAVHNLVLKAYTTPIGADAAWHHSLGYATFANQVKYQMNENEIMNEDPVKENPVVYFYYNAAVFKYFCVVYKQDEIWSGLNGETNTYLNVYANNLSALLSPTEYKEDDATVDGRPIKIRKTIIGQWKGYDIYAEGGPGMELYANRYVLIHRNGESPYIPVTRKQYLERCISHVSKFYDRMIADMQKIANPQNIKEQKEIFGKQKNEALQRFRDELDKTTKEGLLDSAAIITAPIFSTPEADIFITEAQGGSMLVTENPKYMHNVLPKYTPQLFVLKWSWESNAQGAYFRKMIEENFSVEKLQAMIDK